jgi:hypothetical protein
MKRPLKSDACVTKESSEVWDIDTSAYRASQGSEHCFCCCLCCFWWQGGSFSSS